MNILVYGIGAVGKPIFDLLSTKENINLTFVSRNPSKAEPFINEMKNLNYFSKKLITVNYLKCDATNILDNKKILKEVNPDIILNTSSLIPWWEALEISSKLNLEIEFGAWIPFNLLPIYKIVQALQELNLNIPIISASFPDSVNNIIVNTLKYNSIIGCGNIDLILPLINQLVVEKYDCAIKDIEIKLIGHHSQITNARVGKIKNKEGLPYLNINIKNFRELTDTECTLIIQNIDKPKRPNCLFERSKLVTTSMLEKLTWLISDNRLYHGHCAGVNGLIGGYPVQVKNNIISLNLPKDISLIEAQRINKIGQELDGIKRVDIDGKIYFTEKVINFYKILDINIKEGISLKELSNFCKIVCDKLELKNYSQGRKL